MKISIVVPTYNGEKYLAETLESVLAQTLTDWELVIVDDGCKDATPCLAQPFVERDRRIRMVRQANGGIAAARNCGFAETDPTSEYVLFLDHDDVLEPHALATLASALAAHPEAVAAHGAARFIDEESRPWRPGEAEAYIRERHGIVGNRLVAMPLEQPTTFAIVSYRNYVCTVGQVMIRRAAFVQAGPFDPRTVPNDDWDMWLRLSLCGPLVPVDTVVIGWRQHRANTSGNGKRMWRSEAVMRRKYYASPTLSKEQRRIAALGYRYFSRTMVSVRMELVRECWARRDYLTAVKFMRRALINYLRWLGWLGIRE